MKIPDCFALHRLSDDAYKYLPKSYQCLDWKGGEEGMDVFFVDGKLLTAYTSTIFYAEKITSQAQQFYTCVAKVPGPLSVRITGSLKGLKWELGVICSYFCTAKIRFDGPISVHWEWEVESSIRNLSKVHQWL